LKKLYTVLLALLVMAAMIVGIWSLADVDATESKMENRRLSAKPEFTFAGLLDGSYVEALETYYSDTFPGREALLKANQTLNKFYYFSGSKQDNMLVLDFEGGGMEQGGQALEPLPEQETKPEQTTKPDQPVQLETSDPKPETTPDTPNVPEVPDEPDETAEPVDGEVTEPEEEDEPVVEEPKEEEEEETYVSDGSIVIIGDNAMDIPTANENVIRNYAGAVNNIHKALGDDVRVISLVTPNSAGFYAPKDFQTAAHDQEAMIELCYSAMDADVVTVNPYQELKKHEDEYIYFRTDHHWTALGAYYAYTVFCETLGLEAVPLKEFETGVYEGFLGSMYTWTSQYPQSSALRENPDTLTYYLPIVETHAKYYADADIENSTAYPVSVVYRGISESESNKYMCFLGGDHPATVVECAVEGPTCLVLKESYGNAFIPFLTSHYSKIIVIDPREFNRDGKPSLDLISFAEQQQIDDVIVINYPFMINNAYYVSWLNRLVGMG